MRRGGRIMILFGLVLGIITAVVTLVLLRNSQALSSENNAAAVPQVPVLVAFQPVEPYQPIPADAIGVREWPQDAVPPDAITDTSLIADKLPATRIYPGQIILQPMLIDKQLEETRLGLGSDPAYIIPEGQVAVSIPIDDVRGVGGTIRDGDRVDIIATFDLEKYSQIIGASGGETISQLILQNILVFKVGPWNLGTDATGQSANQNTTQLVTLILDPQDAIILKKAQYDSIALDLALRAISDTEERQTDPVGDRGVVEDARFRTEPLQPLP